MWSKSTALALAVALVAAPVAMAQQGTVGSPGNPGGGGTTMGQGTPGTNTAPGRVAPPGEAPRTDGAAAPGTNNPPTTTTPAEGANSFTEGQARSRIEAAGYTDVQGLQKDDRGVWRGRAMRNGQPAEVGLDFQGNVVTGGGTAR
ncbi:PepSY domain-containing protein [Teichococcus rhizosphaerae]|nr:PepSY domain-containing protein [Pseudoroseomonas rhizosphaerae]